MSISCGIENTFKEIIVAARGFLGIVEEGWAVILVYALLKR